MKKKTTVEKSSKENTKRLRRMRTISLNFHKTIGIEPENGEKGSLLLMLTVLKGKKNPLIQLVLRCHLLQRAWTCHWLEKQGKK